MLMTSLRPLHKRSIQRSTVTSGSSFELGNCHRVKAGKPYFWPTHSGTRALWLGSDRHGYFVRLREVAAPAPNCTTTRGHGTTGWSTAVLLSTAHQRALISINTYITVCMSRISPLADGNCRTGRAAVCTARAANGPGPSRPQLRNSTKKQYSRMRFLIEVVFHPLARWMRWMAWNNINLADQLS